MLDAEANSLHVGAVCRIATLARRLASRNIPKPVGSEKRQKSTLLESTPVSHLLRQPAPGDRPHFRLYSRFEDAVGSPVIWAATGVPTPSRPDSFFYSIMVAIVNAVDKRHFHLKRPRSRGIGHRLAPKHRITAGFFAHPPRNTGPRHSHAVIWTFLTFPHREKSGVGPSY